MLRFCIQFLYIFIVRMCWWQNAQYFFCHGITNNFRNNPQNISVFQGLGLFFFSLISVWLEVKNPRKLLENKNKMTMLWEYTLNVNFPYSVCRRGIFNCTSYPCPAVCTIYGDRHYYTFDGLEYDYVSDCQAYLLKVGGWFIYFHVEVSVRGQVFWTLGDDL